MTSIRLPGKVIKQFSGQTALAHVIERLNRVQGIAPCVIATTVNASDDPIEALAEQMGVACYRGSEMDVLSRFSGAALEAKAHAILRVTSDCPLIDPEIVARVIDDFRGSSADYVSNVLERTYPIGMDAEVFTAEALAIANKEASAEEEREHVTPYIYRRTDKFSLRNVAAPPELRRPEVRLTLDTQEDLDLITGVFEALYNDNPHFTLADILHCLGENPTLAALNKHVSHNWLT